MLEKLLFKYSENLKSLGFDEDGQLFGGLFQLLIVITSPVFLCGAIYQYIVNEPIIVALMIPIFLFIAFFGIVISQIPNMIKN